MHPIYEQNVTKIGERYQPKIIGRCTHDDLKTDTGPDFLPSKHRTFFQIHIDINNM